ncbi:MAG: six-cysteine ranthipeptide SCIFF [Firmicutes bacterium]|nr:six-cysteine ranthipeptide SCIFF [Bacillota bacterium]
MTNFKKAIKNKICTDKNSGCGECQTSCQSACKTSCTVGNQSCQREEPIKINKQEKN